MMLTAHSIGNARIAALGMMSFVRHPKRLGRDLFADARLTPNVDDELYYRNFISTLSENQDHQGPLMSEVIGTTTPAKHIEGACALSGLAVRDTRDETTRDGSHPVNLSWPEGKGISRRDDANGCDLRHAGRPDDSLLWPSPGVMMTN